MNILLADKTSWGKSANKVLNASTHTVTHVTTTDTVVGELTQNTYDVVLLGYMNINKTTLASIKQIVDISKDAYIIVLANKLANNDYRELNRLGVDDFIEKSFAEDALKAQIDYLFDSILHHRGRVVNSFGQPVGMSHNDRH